VGNIFFLNKIKLKMNEDAAIKQVREIIESTYSHVDGRDLLAELNLNQAHFVNIMVRIDGRFKEYEGDWLKRLMAARDKAIEQRGK
jgi:hypothetical protein